MLNTLEYNFIAHRKEFNEDFRLRIHRAMSWLKRAQLAEEDHDTKFISLWIAFNAAYAKELMGERAIDKATFQAFIKTICELDSAQSLQKAIWEKLPQSVTKLVQNRYTYQPFWKFHNGQISKEIWLSQFNTQHQIALTAIRNKNTSKLLIIVFEHLYILRNQIIHGGATYNSIANRTQLKEACEILFTLIPLIISIMMDNPNKTAWGKPFYPYIKENK
ncbi:HEPN domain-containing protein [Pasteurella multocida]|uniref:HEPN domain-containing protein n=2 Tax=Pasteurella multocida TaxID=747 RepID=UPI0007ED7D7D|nr:HEPN domain-containing protein [Pasteurella multocida]MCL7826612.1 HEPN domain-containing protein [Pasteurella multocida]MCL7840533.1 HEPN domain-containing protein [Pasteurella multocida]OBP32984.1 hypothetical protein A0R69_09030 [Pasteurella multocida subsp. multocida]PNM10650.1 hypothetical protein A6J59_008310 [Pasteurella multocida]URH91765.1 HEPN domain-containing protein [Pasteurella multocida]